MQLHGTAVPPPSGIYESLVEYAQRLAEERGRRSPCAWSSPPQSLLEGLIDLLDHIAAICESRTLASIPSTSILDLISGCGFDDRDQAETALRSYCYDLYRNVLTTWPKDARFLEWLSTAVETSFRKFKLDTDTEELLLTQLRPPELSDLREITRSYHTPATEPTLKINSNASKRARRRLTGWRFREGSSDEMHLIDIKVGGGTDWVGEEYAHRKFKRRLLKFWERQGGRERAIVKAGGAITENTRFLITKVLDERSAGSEYYVEWVGYGSESRSWEPKSGIPEDLIRAFRRANLLQS
ncbi:hypothetical protein N658DRAFT_319714 [Parathielavia hyrcaniae]|uniref:Chromo domain-containing protein n=1 Tax=Parathielavia hyrcaniae TaxID=113614 RepID=A0AAN6SXF5_9PEZI|nr:hypothetical protein N658DRAFT_319714 [Parathielavia hyrcaniae]